MTDAPSQFIWYELMTTEIDAAAKFYGAVVGWTLHDSGMPGFDYRILHAGDTAIGGMLTLPEAAAAGGMKPGWFGYINVADVDACLAAVTAAGGSVCMPANDIPGVGRIAMIRDPQGAAIYVMAPSGTGPSTAFAPGKPGHCGWNELHAADGQAAFSFYSVQFGWSLSSEMDMGPMGKYLLFNAGSEMIGGMMTSPNMPHPAWLTYFMVDDITTAQVRVADAGGSVIHGAREVPGGAWVVNGIDPQGVMFALVGPKLT